MAESFLWIDPDLPVLVAARQKFTVDTLMGLDSKAKDDVVVHLIVKREKRFRLCEAFNDSCPVNNIVNPSTTHITC